MLRSREREWGRGDPTLLLPILDEAPLHGDCGREQPRGPTVFPRDRKRSADRNDFQLSRQEKGSALVEFSGMTQNTWPTNLAIHSVILLRPKLPIDQY
jgi:hypothetical protein